MKRFILSLSIILTTFLGMKAVETARIYKGMIPGTVNQTMEGVSKDYSYELNYSITYNSDETLTIYAIYNWTNGVPVGTENFSYILVNGVQKQTYDNIIITDNTYKENDVVSIMVKVPFALGAAEVTFQYTVGSVSEIKPALTASVGNVTDATAEINWSVKLPEELTGADYVVKLNDEVITSNPHIIEGLQPETDYSYTLSVEVTLDGGTYTNEVELSFKTEAEKRELYVSAEITSVKTKEATLEYSLDLSSQITEDKVNVYIISGLEDQTDPMLINANPFTITGLHPNTEYNITLEAQTEIESETFYSNQLPLNFKTEAVSGMIPDLSAKMGEITQESVEIIYDVKLPEDLKGATVVVTLNKNDESDPIELTESPFLISGLSTFTTYNFTVNAYAELDGVKYAANPVELEFTTLDVVRQDISCKGDIITYFTDAPIIGGGLQDLEIIHRFVITYTTDDHLTIQFYTEQDEYDKIDGLVPQLMINDAHLPGQFSSSPNTMARAINMYTYTTPDTYKEGDQLKLNIYSAYAGAAATSGDIPYVVGQQNIITKVNTINSQNDDLVDIYTIKGVIVARRVDFNDYKYQLKSGLYIVNGKLMLIR